MPTPLALFAAFEALLEEQRESASASEWLQYLNLVEADIRDRKAEMDPDDIRHLPQ